MKLIDRYVYAVTERLPEGTREDVSRELRANIEDMLPDDATEGEVREVLEKLGSPIKLANEYSEEKRYLIGPELYDNYLSILKLVVGIVAAVVAGIALLKGVISPSVDGGLLGNGIEVFVNVLVAAIEGAVQGFLWVTLVFVILERSGVNRVGFNDGKISLLKNKWSVDDLPELPLAPKRRISRGETLFSMIFTVIFTAILYFNAPLIGFYSKAEGRIVLAESLFVDERLQFYMPLFLMVALFQFSVYTWKFITRQWNMPLAIANTVCNIAVSILMYVMINDISLFNQGFIQKITDTLGTSAAQIASVWTGSVRAFVAVFILICLWDSINGFLKCRK